MGHPALFAQNIIVLKYWVMKCTSLKRDFKKNLNILINKVLCINVLISFLIIVNKNSYQVSQNVFIFHHIIYRRSDLE